MLTRTNGNGAFDRVCWFSWGIRPNLNQPSRRIASVRRRRRQRSQRNDPSRRSQSQRRTPWEGSRFLSRYRRRHAPTNHLKLTINPKARWRRRPFRAMRKPNRLPPRLSSLRERDRWNDGGTLPPDRGQMLINTSATIPCLDGAGPTGRCLSQRIPERHRSQAGKDTRKRGLQRERSVGPPLNQQPASSWGSRSPMHALRSASM